MQKFSIQEALKYGWETFKKYPVFLIAVVIIVFAISSIFNSLYASLTNNGQNPSLVSFIAQIVGMVINMIVSMGMAKIAITLARGNKPEWEDLYNQYPKIINYFVASILFGLMVVVGLILLIVPGIYLALRYHMYSYLIVDKNLGDNFMKNYIAKKEYHTVGEVFDHICEIPEFVEAIKGKNGPQIVAGSAKNRAGKVMVNFTGGTNPSSEIYREVAKAGVGTIIEMHVDEKDVQAMRKLHVNVIDAGHMAADSIGANVFLDELEKKGVEVIPCSGLIRVRRSKLPKGK